MKRITLILLASSMAMAVDSSRTSTVTVTTTYTSTSTIDGYTVTKRYICAELIDVMGPCELRRNLRDTLILDDKQDFTEMFPDVSATILQPTETLRGETTEVIQLLDYVDEQNFRQQKLDSKLSTTNVVESSMQSFKASFFGWNTISLWNRKESQPRIFLVQIFSIFNLILHKILPPATVTTTTTISTETSVTATVSVSFRFAVLFCTPDPFPFSVCPTYGLVQ